jgi:MOSC domain-containing protein YiiM
VRQEDLFELSIKAGELRENIVIAGIDSNKFIPGAMIEFGVGAKIRLTFHCEPCKRIAHLVKSLMLRRSLESLLTTGATLT